MFGPGNANVLPSLFPFPCTGTGMAMEGSTTSSTLTCSSPLTTPDQDEFDEHNMWNPKLGLLCHVDMGVYMGAVLDDESLRRIALSCHFALDISCSKEVCGCPLMTFQLAPLSPRRASIGTQHDVLAFTVEMLNLFRLCEVRHRHVLCGRSLCDLYHRVVWLPSVTPCRCITVNVSLIIIFFPHEINKTAER